MATIEMSRNHTLGIAGAHQAIENIAQQLHTRLGVDYRWDGETMTFDGSGVDGHAVVGETNVQIEIHLGLFVSPMQGMIRDQLEKYLDTNLK